MTTKNSERSSPQMGLPLVMHGATLLVTVRHQPARDLPTTEDPLPPALETGTEGYISARRTRCTDVERETTDDN
jgi:hypothetical protein